MGLLRSLSMLFSALLLLLSLPEFHEAQSTNNDARALDALLQDYAFRALVRPRTGVPYDAVVPSNLSGIQIAALRLRSGSLRTRGVSMYKDFRIPTGVVVQPYVERLVFVYQNLGNWSVRYYPLPGYTYLTPVLGLLAYSASDLSATNLPELDFRAAGNPITIAFSHMKPTPDGSVAKCVSFDDRGLPSFSNVVSGNICSTVQAGHFSIVVESVAPAPAPAAPSPPNTVSPPSEKGKKKKKISSKVWIILGSVLGGLLLLALLSFLVLWAQKLKWRKEMQKMEKAAEVGEPLQMTPVGETKAPAATVTRTQPSLENEYVP